MYQPKLREDLIPRLYHLGKALGVPMTSLASVLLELGITRLEQALERMGYTQPENDPPKPRQPRKRTMQSSGTATTEGKIHAATENPT
jgi:hypothetical protein